MNYKIEPLQKLEPEGKSKANNAVAQGIANHVIGHAGIGKADAGCLQVSRNTRIFNDRINTLEIGMIEHVLECSVEFQIGAFIQPDVLEQSKIGDVGDRILGEVARAAKRRSKNALCCCRIDDVTNLVFCDRRYR